MCVRLDREVHVLILELLGRPIIRKMARQGRNGFYNPSSKELQQIRWQITPHAPKEPYTCPIEMYIFFYFSPPKKTSKRRKEQMYANMIKHTVRPDYDNTGYIYTNAMTGLIYQDDSQIWHADARKLWGETEKTVIHINPNLEDECFS